MNDANIDKVVCIYAGRFQPFGPHHLKTYRWLQSQFDDVYITTTEFNGNIYNPFNFKQKFEHMVKMGIPDNKIFEEEIALDAKKLLKKFDPNTTAVVYSNYEKWDQRKWGDINEESFYQYYNENKDNLLGYRDKVYIINTPHRPMLVDDKEVSGTNIRLQLGLSDIKDNDRKKIFEQIFGYYDENIFKLMVSKFKEMFKEIDYDMDHKTIKSNIEIPVTIYYKRFFDTFYHFFDAISNLAPDLYFWIYGGVFRKSMHGHKFDTDIDLYVSCYKDYEIMEDVLFVMGFNKYSDNQYTRSYTLFGLENIVVDLIMPPDVMTSEYRDNDFWKDTKFGYYQLSRIASRLTFLSPESQLFWADFTNSAISLDSNFDLRYSNGFFQSTEAKTLEAGGQHWDAKYMDILREEIKNHKICKENPQFLNIVLKLMDYLSKMRYMSTEYYRTEKFVKEGWDLGKQSSNNSKSKLSKDILDNFIGKEDEFYDDVVELFTDILVKDEKMIEMFNNKINKVNLREIFLVTGLE